jgi:alanine racemase
MVNMNGMTVDVTDCPGVSRGDEVVIIGKQGRREISVRSFGDLAGHLNYEVLAQLPDSIPRTVTA